MGSWTIVQEGVRGFSYVITASGRINVAASDLAAVLSQAGAALVSISVGWGQSRAREAAITVISAPFLETYLHKARAILFTISGSDDLTLLEVNQAAEIIYDAVHPQATITFGQVTDEGLHREQQITLIASGFDVNP